MSAEVSDYIQQKLRELQYYFVQISRNLFNDLPTNLEIISYPFRGIKECFTTTKYGYLIFNIFLNYMVSYITSCILYFYCIFPLTCLIYSLFLGPAGFLFALGHGAAFCNIIACHETRISSQRFMNSFFTFVLPDKMISEKSRIPTEHVFRRDPVSWRRLLLAQIARLTVSIPRLFIWFLVSFIPVFGTVLVRLLSSAPRGFSYFLSYLKNTRKLDKSRLREIYYKRFGTWLLFGITTGFLECIPILAGLTISSSTLGCALWEVNHAIEIEKSIETSL